MFMRLAFDYRLIENQTLEDQRRDEMLSQNRHIPKIGDDQLNEISRLEQFF